MTAKPFPACGSCHFAIPDNGTLWCHHSPPAAAPMPDGSVRSAYPPVGADKAGCGEHKPARRSK